MKFGKRVRSLASPEWAADYVDYKALKREIKLAFAEENGDDILDKRVTWFQTILESEMQKLNVGHARILDELVNRGLKPLQRTLGTRWVLPHATARTLLLEVLQLSSQVDAFRRFVVLNSLALVKIAKKFDKAANAGVQETEIDEDLDENSAITSRLKAQVLEDLKCQPFYDGAELDALCDETAALTDRVMLAYYTVLCSHVLLVVSVTGSSAPFPFVSALSSRAIPLDVAPLVASPMRQILAEAFEVGNAYLREVEDQYAALAPLPSATFEEPQSSVENLKAEVEAPKTLDVKEEEKEPEPPVIFEKGDIVEILHGEQWYVGVVLQRNEDTGADDTYSVLWWVKDKSQRFGQRTPRHLLHAKSPSLQGGKITSTSVKDNSGSQEQPGSVGSGSYGSNVGDGEVGAKHILHFSDVHLNISESLDGNESAEIPIQYGYDAPISLLTSALEYAKQILPNPDFFLYTGDHAVHGNPSDEYLAEAVNVNVETMAQYFSGSGNETLNATAVLGDTDTKNYTMNVTDPSSEENPTIEVVSPAWSDSLSATNLKDLKTRGYLSYKLDEKLVLLTLNTVPYSPKHKPDATNETDPFGQFAWLNATLWGLRNGNKFAYIAGHIPPIIDAQDGSPMWEASYIDSYKKIVTQYADVIKAQIFGHTHSIEFRLPLTAEMESQDPDDVIADDNSDQSLQLVPLFMSAAISPIFYNNPAFMVWDFDPSTYDLMDFTVYGTNLSDDNQTPLDWMPLFKASTAYNVTSLSWSEMNNFIVNAATDSALVERYYYNSQAQSYQQTSCEDTVCLTWYLCSMMWWSTPEDYTACLAAGSRLESTSAAASTLPTPLVLASIAILIFWL
ncbi:hypothetical protein JG687_00016272 [Phytophthora cactorum]|uniref:SPX domain-containing protein n=1 Tax=Phytophthora cactorum TaxID=29920 RepID=A0A8T1TU77_9STRA|nr:hypothetical protein JG687_00016272 [Phytophthora cactorum]